MRWLRCRGRLGRRELTQRALHEAVQNRLVEVDRAGKEVFSYSRPSNDIWAAYRAPDGTITFFTSLVFPPSLRTTASR